MLQRTLSALVGIPVVLAAIWWGNPWLTVLVAVAAGLGVREAYRLVPPGAGALPVVLGVLWALALVFGAQAASGLHNFLVISAAVLAAGAFVSLLWLIAFYYGGRYLAAALYLIGGPVCVAFLLSHGLVLREIGGDGSLGRDWLLFAILVTFATDSGAYLTGRTVGRHRMAPGISPNKTWEGAGGGFLWAVLAALALGLIFDLALPRWQQAVVGAAVGVGSQIGDLFESKLKRISNVKDAGGIVPGHGGILDRLDSVVVSVPVVYYLLATVFEP